MLSYIKEIHQIVVRDDSGIWDSFKCAYIYLYLWTFVVSSSAKLDLSDFWDVTVLSFDHQCRDSLILLWILIQVHWTRFCINNNIAPSSLSRCKKVTSWFYIKWVRHFSSYVLPLKCFFFQMHFWHPLRNSCLYT